MQFCASFAPTRRGLLQLLAGASVGAMTSASYAETGQTLQDLSRVLPSLPQTTLCVARKVITMEPNSDGADAVVVVGDRVIGSGPRAEIEAQLGDQPYTIDDTFADKVIIAGLIDQHVHPVLAALTMSVEIIAIEDWALPGGTSKAAVSYEDYIARVTAAEAAR